MNNKFKNCHFIDTHFEPKSSCARMLVEDLVEEMIDYAFEQKLRKRELKEDNRNRYIRITGVILSNLFRKVNSHSSRNILLPVNHRGMEREVNYDPEFNNNNLNCILNLLSTDHLSYIIKETIQYKNTGYAFYKNHITTIDSTDKLVKVFYETELESTDFHNTRTKYIVLKEKRRDYHNSKKALPITNLDLFNMYNQQMGEMNDYISTSNIKYHGDPNQNIEQNSPLIRYFCGSLSEGGRTFGGFWQNLSKDKRKHIMINNETCICLDYSQLYPMMLYGYCNEYPINSDCYKIKGFEEFRLGIKKVMGSLLFRKTQMTRFPKHVKDLFPKKSKLGVVKKAIFQEHSRIAHYFDTEIGYKLQFEESELCLRVFFELMKDNILVLPIHDAFLVQKKFTMKLKEVMQECFKQKYGIGINVHE